MFKIGDIVRIKSYDEVIEVNKKMGTHCPGYQKMISFCGKTGRITYVSPNQSWVIIDISKNYTWRNNEISPVVYNNFFPLRMWL